MVCDVVCPFGYRCRRCWWPNSSPSVGCLDSASLPIVLSVFLSLPFWDVLHVSEGLRSGLRVADDLRPRSVATYAVCEWVGRYKFEAGYI